MRFTARQFAITAHIHLISVSARGFAPRHFSRRIFHRSRRFPYRPFSAQYRIIRWLEALNQQRMTQFHQDAWHARQQSPEKQYMDICTIAAYIAYIYHIAVYVLSRSSTRKTRWLYLLDAYYCLHHSQPMKMTARNVLYVKIKIVYVRVCWRLVFLPRELCVLSSGKTLNR